MAKVVKRDNRWIADYYDAQGKRHRESRRTKREAEQLMAQRMGQIQKGSYRPDGRTKLFGDFAKEWLRAKASGWSPNTYTLYSNSVNRYLLHPNIGLMRFKLSAIDLGVAERFKTNLINSHPNLAPRTINLALTSLGAILKHAVRHGYRSENPVQYLDKLPERRREIDPLNSTEVEKLLSKAKDIDSTLHILVSMGIYTGMRLGELLALRWHDADFESGSLRVQGTNSHQKHRDRYIASGEFSDPKTDRSRRTVKLSPKALQILSEHCLKAGNPGV
jgi:integrase